MPHGTEQACVVGPKTANHFWCGSVGDYRLGAITGLILTGQRSRCFPISNCRLPIFEDLWHRSFPLLYRNLRYPASQLAIGNRKSSMYLVDLARLERATSTFAQSRSRSVELQVPKYFRLKIGLCPTNFSLSCVTNSHEARITCL